MSKQLEDYSFHYDISIRNEYTRFAFMFYLFTILALLTTIFLFLIANNSYYNESESIQRRVIPYSILGLISLILFFIFFVGSFVYTSKLIKKIRFKQTINSSDFIEDSIEITKSKPIQSFLMNTDDSYYASTKMLAEQKSSRTSHPHQTDV